MSATLLIDLGNSRIKWAWLREARLGRQHAAVHAGGLRARSCGRRRTARPRGVRRVRLGS
jgi:pantothenate kinase type III